MDVLRLSIPKHINSNPDNEQSFVCDYCNNCSSRIYEYSWLKIQSCFNHIELALDEIDKILPDNNDEVQQYEIHSSYTPSDAELYVVRISHKLETSDLFK